MSVARRPLLTATAAGTLLCALWFVPSANATAEDAATQPVQELSGASASGSAPATLSGSEELALADTGSVRTAPYLIGGMAFLGIGAGFVSFAVRRTGHLA
ncbi:hypothetical protein ACWGI8_44520 [Streptomyces sp. NPDC054841]